MAWKTDCPKARHLRCIEHFESNCKRQLNTIRIKEANKQNFFLGKVFGVANKSKGIVDAEDKHNVKSSLCNEKSSLDEEMQLLQKQEGYVPQFSRYLADRQEMIAKSITLKARRKARMPIDKDHTNSSVYEYIRINNVMSQAKSDFLNFSNKRKKRESFKA